MIIAGLAEMEDSDFRCTTNNSLVSVENGVSFNWAMRAKSKIPNVFMRSQVRALKSSNYTSSKSSFVDYYINGLADTAI